MLPRLPKMESSPWNFIFGSLEAFCLAVFWNVSVKISFLTGEYKFSNQLFKFYLLCFSFHLRFFSFPYLFLFSYKMKSFLDIFLWIKTSKFYLCKSLNIKMMSFAIKVTKEGYMNIGAHIAIEQWTFYDVRDVWKALSWTNCLYRTAYSLRRASSDY